MFTDTCLMMGVFQLPRIFLHLSNSQYVSFRCLLERGCLSIKKKKEKEKDFYVSKVRILKELTTRGWEGHGSS